MFCFYTCILWLLVSTLRVQASNLSTFKVDIYDDDFCVSLADINDIRWILYSTSAHEKKCPGYNYLSTNRSTGLEWSTALLSGTLLDNDRIKITALVNHLENLYSNVDEFIVRNKRAFVYETNGEQSLIPTLMSSRMIFEDTFSGDNVNKKHWSLEVRHLLYQQREEFVLYADALPNLFVRNGQLHIQPTVQTDQLREGVLDLGVRCTSYVSNGCYLNTQAAQYTIRPPVHSALIHTRDTFTFRYGRVEIRAKVPKGDWLFPYMLLQPVGNPNIQIRIAFARGNAHLYNAQSEDIGGQSLFGGIVHWVNETHRICHERNMTSSQHYGDAFHIYTLNLQEEGIDVAVDGVTYGSFTENLFGTQQRYYIVLGVSAGGHSEFHDTIAPSKPWVDSSPRAALNFWMRRNQWQNTWTNGNEALIVDYVRVFEN